MSSDEALMLEFQRGSRAAFEELFARYREPLYDFFRRRVSSRERAEDLTRETFLAVIRATERYQPRALVRTYLYGLALKLVYAVMAEIRSLGRVEGENQGGEEVTQQYVDLAARLANSRIAEQRLADVLRQRTGKISDILEVEKEMSRVRGEIERMEAERKNLGDRVSFATLNVTVNEEYQAQLQVTPHTTIGRLRNAAVEGYRNVADGTIGLAVFLLSYGPAFLVMALVLLPPGLILWRRYRRPR
jgi:DNA-directed RNA polymerase specialized sigma24 family protein